MIAPHCLTISSTKTRDAAALSSERALGWQADSWTRMSRIRRVAAKHSHTRAELGTTERNHVLAVEC